MYLQNLNNIYPFWVFEVSEAVLADTETSSYLYGRQPM